MSITGQDLLAQQRLTTVYVLPSGVGQPCRATPGIASGRKANPDFIRWVNYTGGDIIVHLPAGVTGSAQDLTIENGDPSQFLSVGGGTQGAYAYRIECAITPGLDAVGNSSPVIIVE
jgi:hypothetical protein